MTLPKHCCSLSVVVLASEDEEYGLVWYGEALERAKALAKEEQTVIYIRDPITDAFIAAYDHTERDNS